MIIQREYKAHNQAVKFLDEVIDSTHATWKTYYLRATSKMELSDLMGARVDISEAQRRLKESNEKSGSLKKKVQKLKKKIEDAFEIIKPGE